MTITVSQQEIAVLFPADAKADPKAIIRNVAEATGTTVAQLKGPTRTRHIATARMLAYHKLGQTGLSTTRIGELFNRHHTTVIHGQRVIAAKLAEAGAA